MHLRFFAGTGPRHGRTWSRAPHLGGRGHEGRVHASSFIGHVPTTKKQRSSCSSYFGEENKFEAELGAEGDIRAELRTETGRKLYRVSPRKSPEVAEHFRIRLRTRGDVTMTLLRIRHYFLRC